MPNPYQPVRSWFSSWRQLLYGPWSTQQTLRWNTLKIIVVAAFICMTLCLGILYSNCKQTLYNDLLACTHIHANGSIKEWPIVLFVQMEFLRVTFFEKESGCDLLLTSYSRRAFFQDLASRRKGNMDQLLGLRWNEGFQLRSALHWCLKNVNITFSLGY